MKLKFKSIAVFMCIIFALSACGEKEAKRKEEKTDNSVQTVQNIQSSEERNILTDEAEISEDKAIVAAMLDGFASLNYEGAMEYIRISDRELFDFSNSSQKTLYDSLFSKLSYDFGEVYTSDGRLFVETNIIAPDMLDVYGEINLRYLDAMMYGEISSEEEAREFNNKALEEIVADEELEMKTMTVSVELMEDSDGVQRVVFTAELMNAMLGDIQNAQSQVSTAIEEGLEEYNTAKESGALD